MKKFELAMAEFNEDPAKPLAPVYLTTRSDQPNEDQYHHDRTKYFHSQTKLILCFGFFASLMLLIAVTFLVLSLTVFHLRNPHLTVDSISFIQPLDLVNGKVNNNRNVTVSVEISLRNPNPTSFRVNNVIVLFYYGESVMVGESSRRSETISAKRTVKMNLTAEIVTTKLIASVPGLMDYFNGRGVDLKSRVVASGKVKIVKIFKKTVHLQKDCYMKMMKKSSLQLTFQCYRTGHK